ncbi:MAG: RNA methyltransferase [Candidatus Eremiobacterota bacterium]
MSEKSEKSNSFENMYFEIPEKILDQFHIVLVNPKHVKNIGSAARAMVNMGFHNMTVVGRKDMLDGEAYALARDAKHVLEHARYTETLGEALKDMNHIIGTTRRPMRYEYELFTPDRLIPSLLERAKNNKIAILFGPEDTGLQIEHLTFCNQLVRIPTSSEYASINLSQAVLIMCYEIFKHVITYPLPEKTHDKTATSIVIEGLFEHLEAFFNKIDYFPYEEHRHTMQLFRQMFRRCELDDYDLGLLRSILHKTEKYIRQITSEEEITGK